MLYENPVTEEEHRHNFEQKLVMYLFMEEQRENEKHQKEYQKKYYARRQSEARNNWLEARRAELGEDIPQDRREDRREVRARSAAEPSNEGGGRGPRVINSAGLVLLYCENCNKTKPKINYKRETNCEDCDAKFKFKCVKCNLIYKSLMSCVAHIKIKHPGAKPDEL